MKARHVAVALHERRNGVKLLLRLRDALPVFTAKQRTELGAAAEHKLCEFPQDAVALHLGLGRPFPLAFRRLLHRTGHILAGQARDGIDQRTRHRVVNRKRLALPLDVRATKLRVHRSLPLNHESCKRIARRSISPDSRGFSLVFLRGSFYN